ncbi:hypothetical protein [Paraburkholderia sp. J41]|uniref:hypothetical protein n=1 Tax=Paraburkholderia sp. J41 TaxID=2805433 RepID=UPI002AC346EF|nr:hypothetical protein [Paraburkholderia sp. J41]
MKREITVGTSAHYPIAARGFAALAANVSRSDKAGARGIGAGACRFERRIDAR